MSPDFARVAEHFRAAAPLTGPARADYLDRACAGQPELRRELDQLLASHDDPPAFLREPEDSPQARRRIGRYTILRVLGEGGMGTVYEAEQEQPRRTVALKVVRGEHLSPELLRRFELESQVLGRLQHQGIAQVYEAGTVADARGRMVPFFAMELVRGMTLLEHAEARQLDTRARLELLARVCDAVEHAHQKGVIHRDLKPGNILVDAGGQPKILDFGIARATDSDVRATLHTSVGQILGTLEYMSPEQVSGDPAALDTRSDIYALGVIAYELLSGRHPYELEHLQLPELLRRIREDEPTRLSRIQPLLRGDVETIVSKALEKDKTRRYASADALAQDLRRHLRDEPIAARPASSWYHTVKFARRNRGLVAGLAVAFLVLVLGLIGTSIGLNQALHARNDAQTSETAAVTARNKAEAASDRATKIAEFLSDILKGLDRSVARGRDTTLIREMVDHAAKRIEDGELADNPEAELRLRETIGNAYSGLADNAAARRMLGPAVALARKVFTTDPMEVAMRLNDLGVLLQQADELADAEPLLTESLALRQRHFGTTDHAQVAVALENLAILRTEQRRTDQAQTLFEQALAMRRRLHPDAHLDLAHCLCVLGGFLRSRGQPAAAEPYLTEALAMLRRLIQGDHHELFDCLKHLGGALRTRGALDQAEPLLAEAVAMGHRLYRGDHPDLIAVTGDLGLLHLRRGNLERALELLREAAAMAERHYPEGHTAVRGALSNLADALTQRGDREQAEQTYRKALALAAGSGPLEFQDLGTMATLAKLLGERGETSEAETLYDQACARGRELAGGDNRQLAGWMVGLAILKRRRDLDGAEALQREALAMRRRLFPDGHRDVADSLQSLALLLVTRSAPGAGELLREAVALCARLHGPTHPDTLRAMATLGECQAELAWRARERPDSRPAARSDAAEAVAILRDCVAQEAVLPAGGWQQVHDRELLAAALLSAIALDETIPLAERRARLTEAESLLLGVVRAAAASRPAGPPLRAPTLLVRLYALWNNLEPGTGKAELEAEWRARAGSRPGR